jgi:hypothetical protein
MSVKKMLSVVIVVSTSFSTTAVFAEQLNLTLSCYIKSLNDLPVTYYIDRTRFQDKDEPRIFSFESVPTNPDLVQVSGDFTFLVDGRIHSWTSTPNEFSFQTVKDSVGIIHNIRIDRVQAELLHHIDNGNNSGLIYQYDRCEKAVPKF